MTAPRFILMPQGTEEGCYFIVDVTPEARTPDGQPRYLAMINDRSSLVFMNPSLAFKLDELREVTELFAAAQPKGARSTGYWWCETHRRIAASLDSRGIGHCPQWRPTQFCVVKFIESSWRPSE